MNILFQPLIHLNPLLACLTQDARDSLCQDAEPVTFTPGQWLYGQDAVCETLYLLGAGSVVLRRGKDVIGPISAGEVIGTEGLIGNTYAYSARAMTAVEALPIAAARMRQDLEKGFDGVLAAIGAMSAILRRRVKDIADYKMQSAVERLATHLAELAPDHTGAVTVHLGCEKSELAEMLRMDPATLSRTLAKLRTLGVSSGRGDEIHIADAARLRQLSVADTAWGEV